MAKNRVYARGDDLSLPVPDGTRSGDPVVVGQRPGVATTHRGSGGNAADRASVRAEGVFRLPVRGVDGAGNSAVAIGDIIFYVAADTPKLSKKATGVRYGYAVEALTGGQTGEILVDVGY